MEAKFYQYAFTCVVKQQARGRKRQNPNATCKSERVLRGKKQCTGHI